MYACVKVDDFYSCKAEKAAIRCVWLPSFGQAQHRSLPLFHFVDNLYFVECSILGWGVLPPTGAGIGRLADGRAGDGVRRQKSGDRSQETEDRRQKTGDRRQEAGGGAGLRLGGGEGSQIVDDGGGLAE